MVAATEDRFGWVSNDGAGMSLLLTDTRVVPAPPAI
jgi:hypothetical protein